MKIMKIVFIICSCLMLAACGGEKKDGMSNEVVSNNFADKTASAIGSVQGTLNRTEELKKMTPITEEEYRAWLPETVMGLPLTDKKAPLGSQISKASIARVYGAGDKNIVYRVGDYAGKAADTFIVSKSHIGNEQFNQEKSKWYEKAVKKNGYVAIEKYSFGSKIATKLTFLHDNRYHIQINATGFSPDEVWGNLADFKLDDLK